MGGVLTYLPKLLLYCEFLGFLLHVLEPGKGHFQVELAGGPGMLQSLRCSKPLGSLPHAKTFNEVLCLLRYSRRILELFYNAQLLNHGLLRLSCLIERVRSRHHLEHDNANRPHVSHLRSKFVIKIVVIVLTFP